MNISLRILAVAILTIWAGLALAQMSAVERGIQEAWTKTADEAEKIVDAAEASTPELEKLRAEIADYREKFLSGRDQNADRIKTLQSQLDALGPVPESGEEPEDIAALRQSLTDQLDAMRVPRVVSEESFNRANGLISEIDQIIRERQASQLLARGPSPFNVTHWPEAIGDIKRAIVALAAETRTAWQSEEKRAVLKSMLPALIGMSLIGILLIVMGPRWSRRLGDYLRGFGGRGTGIWSFVVSLARIALPYLGIILLCVMMTLSGLAGERGQLLLAEIPQWSLTYLTFKWLADQIVFNESDSQLQFRKPYHQTETRLLIVLLAVMLILHGSIQLYEQVEDLSDASRAFVSFLPVLVSALILLRLQRIAMNRHSADDQAGDTASQASDVPRMIAGLRRGVTLVAMASPILASLGYMNAAEAIIYPAIKTLFLISAFIIVQRFLCDLYGWLTGSGEDAKDSLFAVIAGFVLALVAIPVLAIFWGARTTDLLELWERFIAGFTVGGVTISPVNFITFAAIFAIGYSVTKLIQGGLRTKLLPKTAIDPGGQNAIVSGVGYVGVFLAALIAITGAGIDMSSLAIVAGALSVGIGFGLQTIVSNFVCGIILLVERPISKGDWIEVGGLMGYVRDISVRSTRIETFDRTDVIVPNSDLISGTVTNYTRGNTIGRVIAPVGVAYGTDTKRVEKLPRKSPTRILMVLANPAPERRVPRLWCGLARFRDPGDPARRELGAVGQVRLEP